MTTYASDCLNPTLIKKHVFSHTGKKINKIKKVLVRTVKQQKNRCASLETKYAFSRYQAGYKKNRMKTFTRTVMLRRHYI